MNGKQYLLDTNAVIYLLGQSKNVISDSIFYISFITELELLSYKTLSVEDEFVIKMFLERINIIDIDTMIKNETIKLRKGYRLKLPDSIILATASVYNLEVITNDKELFKVKEVVIKELECLF